MVTDGLGSGISVVVTAVGTGNGRLTDGVVMGAGRITPGNDVGTDRGTSECDGTTAVFRDGAAGVAALAELSSVAAAGVADAGLCVPVTCRTTEGAERGW